MPSENLCMSLSAYEWAVLVALKCMLLDYLNIDVLSNRNFYCRNGSQKAVVANSSPTCESYLALDVT